MSPPLQHPWTVNTAAARNIQTTLVQRLRIEDYSGELVTVAGADVSVTRDRKSLIGGIAVFSWHDMQPIATAVACQPSRFPYIPGYLSFREIPVLLEAWKQLRVTPDLVLCDGQGIAHPRGLGLASHFGLLLNCPSVGCAKKRLVGEHQEVGMERGAWVPLYYENKLVGSVLRTRDHVKPVFVSPGHLVSFDQAREYVLKACSKYRLPDPIRAAHQLVNEHRRRIEAPVYSGR
jgi:deoxyribonuclease V